MTKLSRSVSMLAVVIAAVAAMSTQTPREKTGSEAAFQQLASLTGEWAGMQDGMPVQEKYTLTANGSAVMAETKPQDEPSMITMFTVDGDHLIATHYCSARNQPQMAAMPDDLRKGLIFQLQRVTGMKTADDWHNTGVTITLDDVNHMTQKWTWTYQGKSGTRVFHYARKSS